MTDDYKEILLKYLTGNIEEGTPSNTPYYEEFTYTRGVAEEWEAIGGKTIKCKDGNGKLNGKILCINTTGGKKLTLVDENRNVIATYTAFDSGTAFNYIYDINVDEEGKFYAIDKDEYTNKYRFLLLNNLSEPIKTANGLEYKCVLRNSWFIQGYEDENLPGYSSLGCMLAKSQNSATYYFAFMNDREGGGYKLEPSTLQINVGESNTWTRLQDINMPSLDLIDNYVYFNSNDTPTAVYYFLQTYTNNLVANREIVKISAVGEGNVNNETFITDLNSLYDNVDDINIYRVKGKALSEEKLCIIMYGIVESNSVYKPLIKVYNITPSSLQTLLSQYGSVDVANDFTLWSSIKYEFIDNTLYLFYFFPVANTTSSKKAMWFTLLDQNNNIDYKINCNRIVPNNITEPMILTSTYDFKKIILQYKDNDEIETDVISLIFNDVYYNGVSYESKKSLIPKQGLIYDSSDNIIFARTLYNSKVYNNKTISTLNVPYNMLNTGALESTTINGLLNTSIIEESLGIQKNIYEDLYINIFNTLSMENRNTSQYVDNYQGASRLNGCSSQNKEDYENIKATKVRINYDDGTYLDKTTSATITNNIATYKLTIYVPEDKNISSIDILSNDGNTIYQEIKEGLESLENDKFYNIYQDVHVE